MKEVPNNLDTTTGNLGLTDTEENQIVAFLPNAHRWFHDTLPGPEHLYRQLHDVQPRHRSQLFAVEAREWRPYPDFFAEKVNRTTRFAGLSWCANSVHHSPLVPGQSDFGTIRSPIPCADRLPVVVMGRTMDVDHPSQER